MKMLARDFNNDIFVAMDGRLAINQALAACAQACEHAVKAQLGEMVLAIDKGIPNFQTIWRDATNVAQFEVYLRRAILAVEGVREIQNLTIKVQSNVIFYTATIVTIYGSQALDGTL